MKLFQSALGAVVTTSFLTFTAAPANAVLVETTVTGIVELAEPTNPFGLSVGDFVTAVTVYDDALLTGVGVEMVEIDSDPLFSLTIEFGAFTFTEDLDSDFGTGKPELNFDGGELSGIDIEIDPLVFGGFLDLTLGSFDADRQFFLDDNNPPPGGAVALLEGRWSFDSAVTVPVGGPPPVPTSEPMTMLMLGAGLIVFAASPAQRRLSRSSRRH